MTPPAARRALLIYAACVTLGSGICEGIMLWRGGLITDHVWLALLNMWIPGISCVFVRLLLREGFRDVSFSIRGKQMARPLLLAWLFPLAVCIVAYGIAWATHLEGFSAPVKAPLGLTALPPALRFVVSVTLNLTLGTVLSAISAAGEEIGWRGFMLTRLVEAKLPHPVLLSGLIWSTWHLPLILSGEYAAGPHPVLSAILFVVGTTSGGVVAARVRLDSGSIWPPIVFHSAWNAVIQGSFDRYTAGGDVARATTIWTGESGYLVITTTAFLAFLVARKPWSMRKRPDEAPFATLQISEI